MAGEMVCPHCGQPMTAKAVEDREILSAIKATRGYIYAAGLRNGEADRARWFVTNGRPKGPFNLSQVERVVRLGGLVPYVPGRGDAYTTPEVAADMEARIAARAARRR